MNSNTKFQSQKKAAGISEDGRPESDKAVLRTICRPFCERVKIGNGDGYGKRS